jgi:polyketide cyclase/dehydrase/lipid transport protein
MKILKRIAIIIVIIIAIPLIIALFTKKDYSVEKEITINKPKQEVFGYIKMLKNQVNFSKWGKMDPNARMDYKGTDGTVGFVSAWESDKTGKGEQEITGINEGSRMDVSLHFIKPMEGRASAYFTTDSVSQGQTKVTWTMNGKMNYPMNFMLLLGMNKMLGDELGEGLTNLKGVLEK